MNKVLMPALGADMRDGVVVKWLKGVGDVVKKGDKLAEIETDKTIVEMESYHEGVLLKTLVDEGTRVDVGTLIAYLGEEGEDISQEETSTDTKETSGAKGVDSTDDEDAKPVENTATEGVTQPSSSEVKASPMARRIATENGIDLSSLSGSGPGGRITKQDVLDEVSKSKHVPAVEKNSSQSVEQVEEKEQKPKTDSDSPSKKVVLSEKTIELTTMRQAIARVTLRSKTTAPHFYVSADIDMTKALDLRAELNEAFKASGVKVSINDLVLRATVLALLQNNVWNSHFVEDKIEIKGTINLGVAIALPEGLIVPAILGAENMDLVELAKASKDLGLRARTNKLTSRELNDGTFSTSNLGTFGVDQFAAVIVPPQSGIVAVGAVKKTPLVFENSVAIRQTMCATMSADHRVGDGSEAAKLLASLKAHLESPTTLLL